MLVIISNEALKAHNRGAEFPVGNEAYNRMKKLGTAKERAHLRRLAGGSQKLKPSDVQGAMLVGNGEPVQFRMSEL